MMESMYTYTRSEKKTTENRSPVMWKRTGTSGKL